MAKYILRPSQDITVNHKKYPEDSPSAYVLINEEVPDDTSTYLGHVITTKESTWSCSSSFSFRYVNTPEKRRRVKNAIIVVKEGFTAAVSLRPLISNYRVKAKIKNGAITKEYVVDTRRYPIGNEFQMFTVYADITDIIKDNAYTDYIEVTLTQICDSCEEKQTSDGKYATTESRAITTAWIEVEFEDLIGVHEKNNGTYKAATATYKKINGAWLEISEDECKEILKNNDIRRG